MRNLPLNCDGRFLEYSLFSRGHGKLQGVKITCFKENIINKDSLLGNNSPPQKTAKLFLPEN